ncbi:hypothetical protein DFP72DRAFT_823155, partial [Ephemerocybe angulata]
MNTSSLTNAGSLPGILPVYIGMPVILRMRNLSTELGITNGSQGFLRKIVTEDLEDQTKVPKVAIVHFPSSKVKLEGLPDGYFPIDPVSWSFTVQSPSTQNGDRVKGRENIRVRRYQLPIQPAFAVTGQSSQGKTLPNVLVSLHEGGFGAYVAASRAKSREGLSILHPVEIKDLNQPLPSDLVLEMKRLHALEHNT